ncbi:helix-turn-helix domain-containing protein [Heyndrickxia sporothermodurans]|uniref:Helicase Helix-turn-helix domain-containing protein n=2 Tax=Heyndrickxia sporothermodurans TaxID=46224 RepID=A0A150LC53_9BACI|nr:helix-turn-helix domain-containing protein [Heyndrickxia sporothermodurans]KYD09302.1 hypothetical protein B4102_2568 [Heyndrickxia sporothermodurans]MEB6547651.1 helix-turn-helix domain-containing protein [Heyndrickxia sporothermodurans]
MTFLQALILLMLKKLNGSRTVFSIYHLLKGKKSSQTIQDAHLFRIGQFFQFFPPLKRRTFDAAVQDLKIKGLIRETELNKYTVTPDGEKELNTYFNHRPIPQYFNGLKYQDIAIVFWKRLNLLIQVLSNAIYNKKKYYPIQSDVEVQRWVKSFLKSQKSDKEHQAKQLYQELTSIFSNNPPEDPLLFIIRLTGQNQIGMTMDQAAEHFYLDKYDYWFRFLLLIHYIIDTCINYKKQYPILYTLLSDKYRNIPLTNSTYETFLLINNGYNVSEVAKKRKLKESTIQDHIVEIVLNNSDFDISPYVNKELEQKIINVSERISPKKLKPIKETVGEVTYFQIRLALAKQGEWE